MTTQNNQTPYQTQFPFAEEMEQKRKDYSARVYSHIKKTFWLGMLGCALIAGTPFYGPRIGVKNDILFEAGLTALTCAGLMGGKIKGDRLIRERAKYF